MTDRPTPCISPEVTQFDFWLGEWDLSWPAEQMGGEPGDTGTGTNRVTRLFGHCAIEENFSTSDGGFLGRSLSVFDSEANLWRQTWVDNMGSYLSFSGTFDGEKMELRTPEKLQDGETTVMRMVFRDLAQDSLRWDWQGSHDGGETWNEVWNISYQRRP